MVFSENTYLGSQKIFFRVPKIPNRVPAIFLIWNPGLEYAYNKSVENIGNIGYDFVDTDTYIYQYRLFVTTGSWLYKHGI